MKIPKNVRLHSWTYNQQEDGAVSWYCYGCKTEYTGKNMADRPALGGCKPPRKTRKAKAK